MITAIRTFLTDETGATAIEYGLIAALVSVAAISAMGAVGDSLVTLFDTVAGELDTAAGGPSGGVGDNFPRSSDTPQMN